MPTRAATTLPHLRITTVIALLVANVALVGLFTPTPVSAAEIYHFSCCGSSFGTVNYHRGETITLEWVKTPERSSGAPGKTVVLSATASGPFATVAALKASFARAHPQLGKTNFAANTLHVSDETTKTLVATLHVPTNAGVGFYELTEKIVKGSASATGGLIFTVRP